MADNKKKPVQETAKAAPQTNKSFISELSDLMKDPKFGYDEEQIMIKTGMPTVDFLNGNVVTDKKAGKKFNIGINAGKIITVIGKTGTGKSTFAIQMASNIVQRYDQSTLFILDFEQSNTRDRVRMITGMDEETFDQKVSIRKIGISTETVLELASQIKTVKIAHQKELLTDNKEGILDRDGEVKKILPPTVVIVDSVAMMMPREVLAAEEISGQMTATALAKANTQLFKRLVQVAMQANIIFIFINHINQKIEANAAVPTQAQVNFLSMNESLPGGNAPIYLTDTLFRLTASTKLEEDKGYKIKGFEVKLSLVKSRLAAAGRSTTLIFNQSEGFESDLSLLEHIKANGMLKGAGVSFFLEGMEDAKFRLGDFKEKLKADKKFAKYFYELGEKLLANSIRESSRLGGDKSSVVEMQEEAVDGQEE
jgi:RecA/RadA recombinase